MAGISSDDGKTWTNRRVLESDPEGWYCYTAIHSVDDAVLLAYCAGNKQVGGGPSCTRIRRVGLDWLRQPSRNVPGKIQPATPPQKRQTQ